MWAMHFFSILGGDLKRFRQLFAHNHVRGFAVFTVAMRWEVIWTESCDETLLSEDTMNRPTELLLQEWRQLVWVIAWSKRWQRLGGTKGGDIVGCPLLTTVMCYLPVPNVPIGRIDVLTLQSVCRIPAAHLTNQPGCMWINTVSQNLPFMLDDTVRALESAWLSVKHPRVRCIHERVSG